MKVEIPTTKEVDVKYITIEVAVRYEEEDMPNNAPCRDGDMWRIEVNVDTGQITNWPPGQTLNIYMKVVDEGTYRLFDADRTELACIEQNYVPNGIVPGRYGDYIEMNINENGMITNWPKQPTFADFWPDINRD